MFSRVRLMQLLILSSLVWGAAAEAAKASLPLVQSELTFKGIFSERAVWFRVPELWRPQDQAAIKVTFRFSSILDLETSSLTLHMNDRPAQSVRLIDFRGQAGRWVEATLRFPAGTLNPGWNKLELTAYLRSRVHDCEDRENPGLWMIVSPKTALEGTWEPTEVHPDLARFPASYVARAHPDPLVLNTLFVVPEGVGEEALSTLGTIASVLGQHGDLDARSVDAVFAGAAPPELPDAHVVLVGLEGPLGPILQAWGLSEAYARTTGGATPTDDGALLAELVHPSFPWRRVLVVTASTARGMREAQRLFGNDERRVELGGPVMQVLPVPEWSPPPPPERSHRTFSELRIGDLVTRGYSGLREIDFAIPYPAHWVLGDDTRLVLFLRGSQVLAPESMLEVDVGQQPVASIPLSGGLSGAREAAAGAATRTEAQRVEIPIPTYLIPPGGRLFVTLRFMLEVAEEHESCARAAVENSWALVEGRSFIDFERVDVAVDRLASYPDVLTSSPHLSRLTVVIGGRDERGLRLALGALLTLGRQMKGAPLLLPDLCDDATWSSHQERDRDVLFIGDWRASRWLQTMADKLPAAFDVEGALRSKYKTFGHSAEFYQSAGLVMATPNPEAEGRALVVATAFEPEALERSAHLLEGRLDASRLTGNLAVIKTSRIFYMERLTPSVLPSAPTARVEQTATPSQGAAIAPTAAVARAEATRTQGIELDLYTLGVAGAAFILVILILVQLARARKRRS